MQHVILADCVFLSVLSYHLRSPVICVLYSRAGAPVGYHRSLLRKLEGTHLAEVHFRLDSDHAKCAWRSKHRGKREARVLMSAVSLRLR